MLINVFFYHLQFKDTHFSNLTENVRSRLHPVPHFFFRKNIDYSFNLLLQFTDTSFMCQLFIQNTFSFIISSCFLSWMSKSSISTLSTYFFEKISKNLFKKNSAMRFQNLGDRFSLLGLIMIFYWSSSNHWNSNVLKIFW